MSTKRRLTSADTGPSKKGAHGGHLCRWCNKEVFPPFKTYCGEKCAHEWRLRSDGNYLRSQLFMRDKGVCASCKMDTLALRVQLYELPEEERERAGAALGFDAYHSRKLMLWEADHVVPVHKGGGVEKGNAGTAGLTSFQTLCIVCHRRKSLKDVLPTP